MGTTAAAVALATGEPVALSGPEHYAAALTCLAEAAAPVADTEGVVGAVAVVCHRSEAGTLQLPLARLLAAQVAEHLAGEPDRQVRTLLPGCATTATGPTGRWPPTGTPCSPTPPPASSTAPTCAR